MCVCKSILSISDREHGFARLTGAQLLAAGKLLDHRLDLFAEVGREKLRIVHDRSALPAIPTQMVVFLERLRLPNGEARGVRRPLRRMRRLGRQQEDFPLPNADVARLTVLDDLDDDVAL